jgi:hypothetical protein
MSGLELGRVDPEAVLIAGTVLLIALTALIGGFTVGLFGIHTAHARKKLQAEMEATLKIEMIERGMSAEEIVSVLSARMTTGKRADRWRRPLAPELASAQPPFEQRGPNARPINSPVARAPR